MEKIEWLIDKLKRQWDAQASPASLLGTLQLLQQELTGHTTVQPSIVGHAAVIMPAPQWNANADALLDAYEAETHRGQDEAKVMFELDPYVEEVTPTAEEPTANEVEDEELPEMEIMYGSLPEKETGDVAETFTETPATIPSVEAVEMPSPVVEAAPALQTQLQEKPVLEVYSRFHEPVKDLKKAISINDRYQYINNLFSGDENLFDRSVKTINHFGVLSEAEYWIRRELSVKYGWEESDPLVQQFYSLVSRRFS